MTTSTYPHLHWYDLLCAHAGMEDLAEIISYLHPLDEIAVFNLGVILGLNYSRLKALVDTPTFLQDMLAGWLHGVDHVLSTGVPTWKRLVEALRDPRVCQEGLAILIEQNKDLREQDKLHGMNHTYPLL